ncbi:MAG: glycine cleavage system protein GcvH [Thermoplasmata archaeon]|nr:MAG: glycine cleavage system protein GcvH [Thermoplasmata archaeon]
MKIDEYEMPDDLYYHVEHTYAKVDGDMVLVGLTDFTQKMAGTIKRVVTLEEGDEVQQGKPMGTLSSGKWTGKLYSPISGEIVEVNEDLEDEPSLINDSPYQEGWVVKIKPKDLNELNSLMKTGKEFEAWMKQQIEEKRNATE